METAVILVLIFIGVFCISLTYFFVRFHFLKRKKKDEKDKKKKDPKEDVKDPKKKEGSEKKKGVIGQWIIGGVVIIAIVALVRFSPHHSNSKSTSNKQESKEFSITCNPKADSDTIFIQAGFTLKFRLPSGVTWLNDKTNKPYSGGVAKEKAQWAIFHNKNSHKVEFQAWFERK